MSRFTSQKSSHFRPRLEALDDRSLPSGGVLDPTFGTQGTVTTSVATYSGADAVATYPTMGTANDGKIVAVGSADVGQSNGHRQSDLAVVRYNLDGTLDTTFGGTGQVLTKLGPSDVIDAHDVAIQPDGKVVVAGYYAGDFVLARYNANGALDTSFGTRGTGTVITDINRGSYDEGLHLGLQADGKIVVVGVTTPKNSTSTDLALVRYNANGTLDTTFGTGGKVIQHFASPVVSDPPLLDARAGVHLVLYPGTNPLDPNAGKIVAVAQLTTGPVELVRFNSNGSLDTSFAGGTGALAITTLHMTPSVALEPDGKIVVAGIATGANGEIALARFNPDGTPDAAFGSGGFEAFSPPVNRDNYAGSVTVQSDGKIVVAGNQSSPFGNLFLAVRFNAADGSPDTAFGNKGFALAYGVSSVDTYHVAVALEPDGRIVVAGTSLYRFALARFLAAGPQIGSFAASPNPVAAGTDLTMTASGITDVNPGSTITQVAFYVDSNGDGKLEPGTDTLLGYATQTSAGVWSTPFSSAGWATGTYTLFAVAQDSYGVFGDPKVSAVQVI